MASSGLGNKTTISNSLAGSADDGRGDRMPTIRTAGTPRDGVSRTLAKLEKRIADGEFYEAHQLYRTLCFRYGLWLCLTRHGLFVTLR